MKLGISPDKIVLGLPWYGYNYSCIKYEEQVSETFIFFSNFECQIISMNYKNTSNLNFFKQNFQFMYVIEQAFISHWLI